MGGGAHSETLTARVIGITDGDTITVLVARQTVKVRLANIDAPESGQPWDRARRSRCQICALACRRDLRPRGRTATAVTIATVYCDGIYANREQVRRGMAWVFAMMTPLAIPPQLTRLRCGCKFARESFFLLGTAHRSRIITSTSWRLWPLR